jgi:DNA-binding PucR family transcriptional regulator
VLVGGEHLPALLLHGADPELAAELAARALAPLDALAPGPRAKLLATLAAWLGHPGQVQRVAGELRVHPQTVRYRVARLRELLGDALEDPDGRFELALALRVSRAAGR